MALFIFKVPNREQPKELIISEREKKSNTTFSAFYKLESTEYNLGDFEDASEMIDEMYAAGCLPVITIGREKIEEIKIDGIQPSPSWIKEMGNILVATFGVPAYIPPGQDRVKVKLKIPRERIKPRMTGPNKSFQGVVFIEDGGILPSEMEIIEEETFRDRVEQTLAA